MTVALDSLSLVGGEAWWLLSNNLRAVHERYTQWFQCDSAGAALREEFDDGHCDFNKARVSRDGEGRESVEREGETDMESKMSHLFQVNFFPPLLCQHLPDQAIARFSSCSRSLNSIISPEVKSIQKRRAQQGLANNGDLNSDHRMDSLHFLLCLSYACFRSCLKWSTRPLEIWIAQMAFGPKGYHANSVGFKNIEEIFGYSEDEEGEGENPWFY